MRRVCRSKEAALPDYRPFVYSSTPCGEGSERGHEAMHLVRVDVNTGRALAVLALAKVAELWRAKRLCCGLLAVNDATRVMLAVIIS